MLAMVDAVPAQAEMPQQMLAACEPGVTCVIQTEHVEDGAPEPSDPLLAQKQFGIYLNSGNASRPDFMEHVMDRLDARGVPAFVFDVKDYHVYFITNSHLAQTMGSVQSLYDLPGFVERAKERGFYTIARYVASKDPALARRRPEARLAHPLTGESVHKEWVNPGSKTVLAYNRAILKEVVRSGVDEVNLDYIRFPTEKPSALAHLSLEEKIQSVEDFITMARGVLTAHGKGTKLGISTFAILGWEYESNLQNLAQDVARFAPLVDVISPMAYPATFKAGGYYNPNVHPRSRMYYLVKRTLDGYAEILGGEHAWKLRPWIQGYFVSPKDMRDQIEAVYDSGGCGYTIWSQGNYYSSFYDALWDVEVPERCLL